MNVVPRLSRLVGYPVACPSCGSIRFVYYHDKENRRFVVTCECQHRYHATKDGIREV